MRALDPLSKEEFKRMTNFQTRQIGTDTADLHRVLTVSLQLSVPHHRKLNVAVQTEAAVAKKYADKSVQCGFPYQIGNIPVDSDSLGLLSPIQIPLRLQSLELQSPQAEESSRRGSARLSSDDLRAEEANILHVEDDEDEDDEDLLEDDLDNLMGEEEATGSKIETETDGLAGTDQDQSPGLKPKRIRINSEALRRSLIIKNSGEPEPERDLNTRRRKTASKLPDKLPAVLVEEPGKGDERRTISLKGLKEVKEYFDRALHEKGSEELQKDKVHLKNLIRQLDEFIEFNRKHLSKVDRDLLEHKRKLLEKVESRMVDFSDMQTRFYKTINQQETAKRLNESILDKSQFVAAEKENVRIGYQTPRGAKFRAKNNEMSSDSALILQKVLLQHKAGGLKKPAFMMKSSSLLVMINRVYSDYTTIAEKSKKDRKDFPSVPLLVYFYRYLSMQISNKATLQRNFEKVLGSIVNCSAVTACDLFGKFLGITGSFDHKCFEIFIDILLYWKKTTKSELINRREKDKMMVTWIKMQDLVNYYVGAFVTKEQVKTKDAILSSLTSIVKGAGTLQIDFELAMIMMLDIHRATQVPFEQTVYQAADVLFVYQINGDGTIDFEEFVRIIRHLEPDYFKKNVFVLSDKYLRYSDEDPDTGDCYLNLHDWQIFCTEEGIMASKEILDQFYARQQRWSFAHSCEDLVKNWAQIKLKFKSQVELMSNQGLATLFDKISNSILLYDSSYQSKIWMNYKILEAELDRLFIHQKISSHFLPPQVKQISASLADLFSV